MVVTYEAYLQLSLLGKQGRILKVTGEIDRRNFKLGDLTFQTPLTVDQIVKVPRNLFRHINAVGTSFDLECKVRSITETAGKDNTAPRSALGLICETYEKREFDAEYAYWKPISQKMIEEEQKNR